VGMRVPVVPSRSRKSGCGAGRWFMAWGGRGARAAVCFSSNMHRIGRLGNPLFAQSHAGFALAN
jgi:hypothetical protein